MTETNAMNAARYYAGLAVSAQQEVDRLRELVRDQNELARENADLFDKLIDAQALAEQMQDRVGELTTERDRLSVALKLIGTDCANYTGPGTCRTDPQRRMVAEFGAERWCDQCISAWGLEP